jgi:death-on-curing protein
MIKFSKDKVLLLHKLIAQETGGSIGLRDEALLDSALENAFAGFDGQEFYPTNEEVVEVGLSVASGTMDYDALLQWVRGHRI